jgi:hypothetical protein
MGTSCQFLCAALAVLVASFARPLVSARADGPWTKQRVVVVRGGKVARDGSVRRRLKTAVVINFKNVSLPAALKALAQAARVNLFVDGMSSATAGSGQTEPVTLQFRYPLSVATALHVILADRGLTYTACNGVLVVGSPDNLAHFVVTRCYRLQPLLLVSTRRHPALINRLQVIGIIKLLQNTVDRSVWVDNGGTVNTARYLDGTLIITAGERDQWRIQRILTALADQVRRRNRRITQR